METLEERDRKIHGAGAPEDVCAAGPPEGVRAQELVHTYRLFHKMMRYPRLIREMREIFLKALRQRGLVDERRLEETVRRLLDERGLPADEANVSDYRNALIDLYFAAFFDDKEIEDHINLARKEERFRNLHRVVNTEGATSKQIKKALKEFCEIPQGDLYINPSEAEGVRVALINHFISNQLPFIGVAKRYITIRDIDELVDHTFWNPRRPGRIGGKAAGMFLAYKIILPRLTARDPDFENYVTVPDSYYFNSGIFSDFLDYNDVHHFHSQKYKTREELEEDYRSIAELFKDLSYPPDMVAMFRHFLSKIGEHPLILRSSSLLEDNFGYAFSGKYDSVFVANQGDLDRRLEAFIWGLKRVHMSIFGPAPILYRRDHNLLDFDERMSVLVQKVVGRRHGSWFFPFAAGVAFSQNIYRWTPRIRKEDGMVRLVLGLGTRAVDRVGQDYPRMVALSHPLLRPEVEAPQIVKYSQKMVDVLNVESGHLESVAYRDVLKRMNSDAAFHALSINQEGHLSPPLYKGKDIPLERTCVTFENFLTRTPFVRLIKKMLRRLEEAYGRPVDVEFAWDRDRLYLLQCRTLSVRADVGRVAIPDDVPEERVLFSNGRVFFSAMVENVEFLVYVDPKAYGRLATHNEKLAVGRLVNRLNRLFEGKRYGLMGPGRWGSNDINLGVRVGYEDINHALFLAELAFEADGVTPDVSFGTHFFSDLVEARIVPVAIYPDQEGTRFDEGFFLGAPNQLAALLPESKALEPVVRVLRLPECAGGQLLHVYQDSQTQQGLGFLGPPIRLEE